MITNINSQLLYCLCCVCDVMMICVVLCVWYVIVYMFMCVFVVWNVWYVYVWWYVRWLCVVCKCVCVVCSGVCVCVWIHVQACTCMPVRMWQKLKEYEATPSRNFGEAVCNEGWPEVQALAFEMTREACLVHPTDGWAGCSPTQTHPDPAHKWTILQERHERIATRERLHWFTVTSLWRLCINSMALGSPRKLHGVRSWRSFLGPPGLKQHGVQRTINTGCYLSGWPQGPYHRPRCSAPAED